MKTRQRSSGHSSTGRQAPPSQTCSAKCRTSFSRRPHRRWRGERSFRRGKPSGRTWGKGQLWHLASAEPVLQCEDTRHSAICLIAATHPLVSADHRKALEEGLFRFDFSLLSDPQARRMRLLGTVFAAIGEAALETDAARALLADGRAEGLNFENRKAFACGRGDGDWPRHEAIDAAVTVVAPLLAAVRRG